MGNYQSDQKTSRFFGLKLNKNTDKDLIEHLEKQEKIQAYLKNMIRNDITREERTMKISALNTSEQKVRVEIDPNGQRHIMVAGEEISNIDRTDLQLSRQIDNALDDLYDLPIYEDGIIHTGKTKTVWVWQEATLVTKTYKIRPEYLDQWGADANEDTILTEDDLEMIARGWETTPDQLLDQLIEQ